MLVVKFGGSILNGVEGLQAACSEIAGLPRPLLVVVSAFENVTNRLEGVARTALHDRVRGLEEVEGLWEDHRIIARKTLEADTLAWWNQQAEAWRERLVDIVEGLAIVGELSPRTLDLVVHYGERLSSGLVAGLLRADVLSATDLLVTNENHRYARVDLELSRERIGRHLYPLLQKREVSSSNVRDEEVEKQEQREEERKRGEKSMEGRSTEEGTAVAWQSGSLPGLVVTEGYIARGRDGEITTMGRESSDFSAALFGEFLGASEVRIFTGVPGIMTADPAVIPDASTISHMSYGMAREIASLGAKIIHPRTVRPAERAGIPLVFNDLQGVGTVIDANEEGEAFSLTTLSDATLLKFRTTKTDAWLTPLLHHLSKQVPIIRSVRSGRHFHVLTAVPHSDPGGSIREGGVEDMILGYESLPVALVSYVREQGIEIEDATQFLSALSGEKLYATWSDPVERSICALVHPDRVSDIVRSLHEQCS